MVNLYRYASSNDKTGYFLRGLSQSSGYFNLNTTPAADRLFDQLEYEPGRVQQTEGDRVPGELTWRMYQAGLLKTNNSDSSINNLSNEQLRETFEESNTSSSLSETNLNILQSFIESYTGTGERRVEELATLLETSGKHTLTSTDTSDAGIDISDESLSQLSDWDLTLDDLIQTPNNYPEETAPYLEGCISRVGESEYTPVNFNLSDEGIPKISFALVPEGLIFVNEIWVTFDDYFSQTSGKYRNIDAKMDCTVVTKWNDKSRLYDINASVVAGSFIEFRADPEIGDVLDENIETDVISKNGQYPRTLNNAREILEDLLSIFTHTNLDRLFS